MASAGERAGRSPGERAGGSAGDRAGAPRRWLMLALGWVFFALGLVGAVLPVLPTTPFMLLALWAFSIGSERFHHWLYHHRVFGPPLQRWKRDRVIPWWGKALSMGSMTASFLYMWLVADVAWYALLGMGAVMAAGIAYIARFPSRARGAAR